MKNRGLYHQKQGDEGRLQSEIFQELLVDAELIEGEFVAILRRLCHQRDWKALVEYRQQLLDNGHSKRRVEAMLTKAMNGLKF